ncbi:MAG TPA: peptide ABC transporter permease, partial [Cystobacter sp.]
HRVGVLQGGKLVEVDTSERLRTGARHPYTRLLLSSFPHLTAEDAAGPSPDLALAANAPAPARAAVRGGHS